MWTPATNGLTPPCFHSPLTILFFSSNTPPISTFHHGQTASGYFRDVWRHQNNVACVWVVGLQMFFFSSLPPHFFFFIFQIKEHVLLLRPKTGRGIYTRILTPASQCLQDVVSLNSQSLSLASSPPHSLPQRTIQIYMSLLFYTGLVRTPFPYL